MNNRYDDFKTDIIDLLSRKRGGHVERWLYSDIARDEVTGSALWSAFIRAAKNYYVLPNEVALIENSSALLSNRFNKFDTIVDLGVGSKQSVTSKVLPIVKHATSAKNYAPVDLSKAYLRGAEEVIEANTILDVKPTKGNFFEDDLELPGRNRLALFFGATISNVDAMEGEEFPQQEIIQKLGHVAGLLKNDHDNLLLASFDSNADPASIKHAYEDAHWKRFVANLSYSMDAVLDIKGNFRPSAWHHESVWDDKAKVLHHMIVASENQNFEIDGQEFDVRKGERFVAINCFKFPVEWFQDMAREAGFNVEKPYHDHQQRMVIQPLRI